MLTFHGSTQIGAVRPLKRLNAAARRALRPQLCGAHSGGVSGFLRFTRACSRGADSLKKRLGKPSGSVNDLYNTDYTIL